MQKHALLYIVSALILASLACRTTGYQRPIQNPALSAPASTALPGDGTAAIAPPAGGPPKATPPTIVQPTSTILSAPGGSSPTAASAAQPLPSTPLPTLSPITALTLMAPTVTALLDTTFPGPTDPAAIQTTLAPDTTPAALDPALAERQMQVFEELWGTIRDHYLYEDFNGLDWNAVGQEYRSRITAGMSYEAFYLAMREMVTRLGDEHSTFFSPEEAQERDRAFQGENQYVGIGVMTAVVPERQRLVVLLVFPGSPAEAAGIKIHDSLLTADGQTLVDAQGARQDLLRGPENSSLELTVQTPGEAPRTVRINRRPVVAQMPAPHFILTTPAGKRIAYIFIPTFNEMNIDEEIGQALNDLAAAGQLDGIILDNRYNSGGASDVLLNTLSYFLDGPVGYFTERGDATELRVRGRNIGGSRTVPLVVLVGEGTASFGEVFAGSLKDLGRAHLIGTVTNGNVEVLSVFSFSDGSRAWIAASSFRPWNNAEQNWEETGIIPDEIVETEWDQVTAQTDPAILAALRYFDNLAATTTP